MNMDDGSSQNIHIRRTSSTHPVSVMHCAQCQRVSNNPTIMPCEHAFCTACISQLNGADAGRPVCTMCHCTFTTVELADSGCQPCEGGHFSGFFLNNYVPVIDASDVSGETMTEICNAEIPRVKVMGMAWCNDQLYVVYHKKAAVYVYNIQSTTPFRVRQTIHPAAGLYWPRGIAVDSGSGCSYIIDWTHLFSGSLWKMAENGTAEKITDVDVQPFGISLADNGNAIIVTCSTPLYAFLPAVGNRSKIIIFTPIGTIRETINLSNDLEIPRHAIRIDRGSYSEYLVIHGWGHKRGQVVCVRSIPQDEHEIPLSSVGQIQPCCYGSSVRAADQSLSKPLSLLDDDNNGILVVDHANNRIHLISSHLQFIQHTITQINRPRHVCLDSGRGVLFVGLENGEIRAFQVQTQQQLHNVH